VLCNDNKCAHCWGEYTEEHPGVRILPCGHIFGRDCLCEMMKGPMGDLCPLCRVKLFRRDITVKVAALAVLAMVCKLLVAYIEWSIRLINSLHHTIRKQPPWRQWIFEAVFDSPRLLVGDFMRRCTDICSRNPTIVFDDVLAGSCPRQLLYAVINLAPMFLLVFFITGATVFRVFLIVFDLAMTVIVQWDTWTCRLPSNFDQPADRPKIACAAASAVLLKELLVVWVVWYCRGWSITMRF
jgi:hypothetical protein